MAVGYEEAVAQIEGNLFLGSSTIVLETSRENASVQNLIITGNVFHSWNTANRTIVVDETRGKVVSVKDTVIESNEVGSRVLSIGGKLSTRATKTVALEKGSLHAVLNFSDSLVFDSEHVGIDESGVRCMLLGTSEAAALSATVSGNIVKVYIAGRGLKENARVSCDVDQSRRSCSAH